jgi:transposase
LKLLGLARTVVEAAEFDGRTGALVVSVRPAARAARRCPQCGRKARGYDAGRGRRRWRGLDLGATIVWLEAGAPRVECPRHGVLVAAVPWARPGAWFTTAFEQQVAWLTLHATRSVVAQLMRVDWATVGGIVARVQADEAARCSSPLTGLVNIGIDETSYKKGHKYMTIVVDHDRNRVVWAAKGHGKTVLEGFFGLLSDEQKHSIRCVTADGARWIADCVETHCPNAVRALDPFHTVQWATDALDEVRRQAWRDARRQPRQKRGPGRPPKGSAPPPDPAGQVRDSRYALLKNPEDLTVGQQASLALIAAGNPVLHRAYRLKEELRLILKLPLDEAEQELARWTGWAQRCRIPVFVELGRKIKRHLKAILDTIRLGLTNARVEAVNNKIKVTIRMGYGFRNIDNLIALVMLKCGGLNLTLPGRN